MTYTVFTGIFHDEIGQRFLKIMHAAVSQAFDDLYVHSMPQNPRRFKDCLDRVSAWDSSVIVDEHRRLEHSYPDLADTFKEVYVAYVKSMRGGMHTKLMVTLPKLTDYLHSYFIAFSRHGSVRDASHFQTPSLLDKRLTCMDALRDSLFLYLGEEHVKLDGASVVSQPTAKPAPSELGRSRAEGETAESRHASGHKSATVPKSQAASQILEDSDEDTVVGPDDSVSNADFAEKQHRAIQRYVTRHGSIAEESTAPSAKSPSVKEQIAPTPQRRSDDASDADSVVPRSTRPQRESVVEEASIATSTRRQGADGQSDAGTNRSSRTSVSLSSVSITQDGLRMNLPGSHRGRSQRSDARSAVSETPSERSMNHAAARAKKKRSPVRSYVTEMSDSLSNSD